MGMYDEVFVRCPHCNEPNRLQSKAGECILGSFVLDDAPPRILKDLEVSNPHYCEFCNKEYSIMVKRVTSFHAEVKP